MMRGSPVHLLLTMDMMHDDDEEDDDGDDDDGAVFQMRLSPALRLQNVRTQHTDKRHTSSSLLLHSLTHSSIHFLDFLFSLCSSDIQSGDGAGYVILLLLF